MWQIAKLTVSLGIFRYQKDHCIFANQARSCLDLVERVSKEQVPVRLRKVVGLDSQATALLLPPVEAAWCLFGSTGEEHEILSRMLCWMHRIFPEETRSDELGLFELDMPVWEPHWLSLAKNVLAACPRPVEIIELVEKSLGNKANISNSLNLIKACSKHGGGDSSAWVLSLCETLEALERKQAVVSNVVNGIVGIFPESLSSKILAQMAAKQIDDPMSLSFQLYELLTSVTHEVYDYGMKVLKMVHSSEGAVKAGRLLASPEELSSEAFRTGPLQPALELLHDLDDSERNYRILKTSTATQSSSTDFIVLLKSVKDFVDAVADSIGVTSDQMEQIGNRTKHTEKVFKELKKPRISCNSPSNLWADFLSFVKFADLPTERLRISSELVSKRLASTLQIHDLVRGFRELITCDPWLNPCVVILEQISYDGDSNFLLIIEHITKLAGSSQPVEEDWLMWLDSCRTCRDPASRLSNYLRSPSFPKGKYGAFSENVVSRVPGEHDFVRLLRCFKHVHSLLEGIPRFKKSTVALKKASPLIFSLFAEYTQCVTEPIYVFMTTLGLLRMQQSLMLAQYEGPKTILSALVSSLTENHLSMEKFAIGNPSSSHVDEGELHNETDQTSLLTIPETDSDSKVSVLSLKRVPKFIISVDGFAAPTHINSGASNLKLQDLMDGMTKTSTEIKELFFSRFRLPPNRQIKIDAETVLHCVGRIQELFKMWEDSFGLLTVLVQQVTSPQIVGAFVDAGINLLLMLGSVRSSLRIISASFANLMPRNSMTSERRFKIFRSCKHTWTRKRVISGKKTSV
eukprot:c20469_g2_i2.p1 GENE.c20469_g2_i2~~c20469_g2_i2.p1  ORF type:complete len:829 (-),score=135.28 c20469_g2_i2:1143-3548(-)